MISYFDRQARTTRRIIVLTPLQTAPFLVICKKVLEELGSEDAATKALGVSSTVFRKLMKEEYLTDKQARIILDKRKAMRKQMQGGSK